MQPFLNKLGGFVRREAVLVISLVCALLSMLAVPPDAAYAGYIDLRVLCLLFCLMAVVAGLQQCGLFTVLAQRLLTGRKQLRLLYLALVLLPFFCSMLITNDVALITFVPSPCWCSAISAAWRRLFAWLCCKRWPRTLAAWRRRSATRKTCFSVRITG